MTKSETPRVVPDILETYIKPPEKCTWTLEDYEFHLAAANDQAAAAALKVERWEAEAKVLRARWDVLQRDIYQHFDDQDLRDALTACYVATKPIIDMLPDLLSRAVKERNKLDQKATQLRGYRDQLAFAAVNAERQAEQNRIEAERQAKEEAERLRVWRAQMSPAGRAHVQAQQDARLAGKTQPTAEQKALARAKDEAQLMEDAHDWLEKELRGNGRAKD